MVFGRQLSRGKKAREALWRSLVRALVLGGKLTTTVAKAKAIRSQIEKLVSAAGENSLASRRRVLAYLGNDRKITDALCRKAAGLLKERKSGFTRIVLLPPRRGDAAFLARMEWIEEVKEESEEKKEKEEKPRLGKKAGKKIKAEKKAITSKETKK